MQRLQRLNRVARVVGGIDINPVTRPSVDLYGESLSLGNVLSQDELDLFKAQFATLISVPGSEERRIMLDRLSVYIIAIRAIKQSLNGITFKGLNPEDTELGMGLIRPQFTRAAAAYKTTWSHAVTTSWADWLYETAGIAYAIGKDFGLCITHVKSLVTPSPFMAEGKFTVGRRGALIPVDTRNLRLGDNENGIAVVTVPTMVLIPRSSLYAKIKGDSAGTDEIGVGGLVIGLGRVLKEETATWTS